MSDSNNVQETNKDNNHVDAEPEIEKRYLQPPHKDIEGIKSKMIEETKNLYDKQRYGFFSILHSNFLGDEHYSQEKVYKNKRDSNGKVITQPRGIYAKSTKKGKFMDSYFDPNFLKENENLIEFRKRIANEEKEKALERVKKLRDKTKEDFIQAFKPGGVKEIRTDILYPDKMDYKIPIWKEPLRGSNIDFKNRKVHTRPRGIWVQSSKKGEHCSPGVLFSYERFSDEQIKKLEEESKKMIEDDINNKKEKRKNKIHLPSFMPNSTSKCDVFQEDAELYSLGDDHKNRLYENYKKRIENSKISTVKRAEHIDSFKPASNTKKVSFIVYFNSFLFFILYFYLKGLKGYFSTFKYIEEKSGDNRPKKMTKEELKKKLYGMHLDPFQLNRLVDSSLYAPPIQTALPNLKKNYPSVFNY